MTDLGAHALASLYLGQFTPTFWCWSDDGEALIWPSGPTIALRDELEAILARLAPHGLPSLSSIALVLAPCRDEWREPAGEAERDLLARFRGADRAAFSSQLAEARLAMATIGGLPAHLRRGVDAKAALLEALLQTAPRRVTAEEAGAVVEALGEGVRPAQPGGLVDWAPPSLFELAEDLEAISHGVAHLDPAALEVRLRTGLSAEVRPAEVELPDSERIRRLLVQLRSDDELSGLAHLALDLLASVHVPRAVSSPGDQPLGGVSDLSNRGPLHRLLISELAHDPLTFTARIAHGEALYLRRETPPRRPPARRAILLDTGIRMWGVPRVFATALGLALAAQASGTARVDIFRSEEDRLVPVDLLTREGILEHLEALEPNPEPAAALQQLLASLPPHPAEDLDVVLVSHADALGDPAFLAALQGVRERLVYLAAVDVQGNYALGVHGPRGRRTLSRATLDLAPLLRPAGDLPGERLWDEGNPELPAILSRDPFPLLLPVRLDPRRTTSHPDLGTVSLTHDGRLMHWPRLDRAGRQLTARAPKGTLHWLEVDNWLEVGGEGVARAVIQCGLPGQLVVLSAQLGTARVRRQQVGLTDPSLLAVVRLGSVLALIYPWQVDALSLSTGVLVDSLHVGERQSWVMGRFFRGEDPRSWQALAFSGGALELVPVPVGSLELVALWDRRGLDGPWGYTGGGRVIDLSHSHEPRSLSLLGHAPQIKGLSRDGHRLVVEDPAGERYLTDLQDPRAGLRPVRERIHHHALQSEPRRIALQAPQLRRRFQAVGLDAQSRLTLVSRRGRCVPFRALLGGKRLVLGPGESDTGRLQLLRDFEFLEPASDVRYRMLMATWPSGSRAWLDSRGLLHLRSGNGKSELTLVLRDQGPLAGWTPRGGLCGPSYLTGLDASEDHDGSPLVEALEQFVRELG